MLNQKKLALCVALSLIAGSAIGGSVDGGTIVMPHDVAVTGTITAAGDYNTVVGSGATISNTFTPANGWDNTSVGSLSSANGANDGGRISIERDR